MSLSAFRLGLYRGVPLVALLSSAMWVHAQGTATPVKRHDPLDAKVPVPVATYTSPLTGYRRLGEDRRIDWKDANETVNRIGGWRTYTREAQQPDAAASAPPARASGAAPAHGSHQKH